MIRAIYRLLCQHEWRGLFLPRFYDHRFMGAEDCLKCGARRRIKRPSARQTLREVVYAINDIERGHTLDKAARLDAAIENASAILSIPSWDVGAASQPPGAATPNQTQKEKS